MLGQFTLRYGDRTISDSDDRSRRVWSLLAYMLYNHGRSFAQEELIRLYWSNGEKSADPGNALKSIFHRTRTALDHARSDGRNGIPPLSEGFAAQTFVHPQRTKYPDCGKALLSAPALSMRI